MKFIKQLTVQDRAHLELILIHVENKSGRNISSKNRERHLVRLRCIYANLALKVTNLSFAMIGSVINRDHSSIHHYEKLFEETINIPYYRKIYNSYLEIDENLGYINKIQNLLRKVLTENKKLKSDKNKSFKNYTKKLNKNEIAFRELPTEKQNEVSIRMEAIIRMANAKPRNKSCISYGAFSTESYLTN